MTPKEYIEHLKENYIDWNKLWLPPSAKPTSELAELFYGDGSEERRELVKSVVNSLTEKERKAIADVPIAFLPFYEANAYAIRPPDGGAVVAIDISLALSLNFIAFNFSRAVAGQDVRTSLDSIYQIARVSSGTVGLQGSVPLHYSEIKRFLSTRGPVVNAYISLSSHMIRFLVLHELFHIILGHIDRKKLHSVKLAAAGGKEVDVYLVSQQQEVQADAEAVRTLVRVAHQLEHNSATAVLPVLVIFGFLELMEEFQKQPQDLPGRTHPSPQQRVTQARAVLRDLGALDVAGELGATAARVFGALATEAKRGCKSILEP